MTVTFTSPVLPARLTTINDTLAWSVSTDPAQLVVSIKFAGGRMETIWQAGVGSAGYTVAVVGPAFTATRTGGWPLGDFELRFLESGGTTTAYQLGTAQPEPAQPPAEDTEGAYVHNQALSDQAISYLIEFFRKPRWSRMLSSLVDQVQLVEDANWDTNVGFDVDTAVGDQLDILGRWVGELRADRTDSVYRAAIRVRILVNQSEGTLEELLTILTTANPGLTVETYESYPGCVLFLWDDDFADISATDLYHLLRQAKPAGVRLQAVVLDDTAGFRFGTVAAAGGADLQAFATVADANTTAGGGLLHRVLG